MDGEVCGSADGEVPHVLPSTLFRRSTSTSSWSTALFESDRLDLVDLSSKDDSSPSPSPSLDAPGVPVPPSPPGDVDASEVCVRGEGMGGALYPAGL